MEESVSMTNRHHDAESTTLYSIPRGRCASQNIALQTGTILLTAYNGEMTAVSQRVLCLKIVEHNQWRDGVEGEPN